jgi:hypothetical protein
MLRKAIAACALLAGLSLYAGASDVTIDPAKAEQLRRLEPLTAEKIDVFVDAGQLTAAQADFVKRNIRDGKLVIPESSIGAEAPRRVEPVGPAPVAPPPRVVAERDIYSDFHYSFASGEEEHLRRLVKDFRHGDRHDIGRELRKSRPQVNQIIAQSYNDPIDIGIKAALWEEVAGPANADAAFGLFETHRAAYEVARPVLIPYEKDVGGAVVRRHRTGPDANETPFERVYSSRDLRDLIENIEGAISRCSSSSAAIFLMDVYAKRYDKGEAPMRDCKRDRHRLVEACGGNSKKFDEDEKDTWKSTLSQRERALIADHLIEWLHRDNGDRRQIARNGLMICLPRRHPDWDDGNSEWERWWERNKPELMTEK